MQVKCGSLSKLRRILQMNWRAKSENDWKPKNCKKVGFENVQKK
jgi:hypothetical protein